MDKNSSEPTREPAATESIAHEVPVHNMRGQTGAALTPIERAAGSVPTKPAKVMLARRGKIKPPKARKWDRKPEFVADLLDTSNATLSGDWLKLQLWLLELPILALTKSRPEYRWENLDGSLWVEVIPSSRGSATVDDGDLVIYLTSKIIEAATHGIPASDRVTFTGAAFLRATGAAGGGAAYLEIEHKLDRLKGTAIKTNMLVAGAPFTFKASIGIIGDWASAGRGRNARYTVFIGRWMRLALEHGEVLGIGGPEYFKLSALEKRLCQLLRKHLGRKKEWEVFMETVCAKSGWLRERGKFTAELKAIVKANRLPGIEIHCDFNTPWDARKLKVRPRLSPLERRLLGLLRKRLKDGTATKVVMDDLHKLLGGKQTQEQFTERMQQVVQANRLPEIDLMCDFSVPWSQQTLDARTAIPEQAASVGENPEPPVLAGCSRIPEQEASQYRNRADPIPEKGGPNTGKGGIAPCHRS